MAMLNNQRVYTIDSHSIICQLWPSKWGRCRYSNVFFGVATDAYFSTKPCGLLVNDGILGNKCGAVDGPVISVPSAAMGTDGNGGMG